MSAEQRLKDLGVELPAPPEQFGIYAEAVQSDAHCQARRFRGNVWGCWRSAESG
jgi:hypothetical protein